jgi:hypothetical protein
MTPRSIVIFSVCIPAALATLGAACSSGSSDGSASPATPTVYNAPDAADAGTEDVRTSPESGWLTANPVEGSPLCNASPAGGISTCFPDNPSTVKACRIAPDGGAYDPSADYDGGILGCHVVSEAGVGDAPAKPTAACLPSGTGTDGAPCHLPTDCAASHECVGAGVCRRYCCSDPCDSYHFCDVQPETATPSLTVPVCMPIRGCVLFEPSGEASCGANETCAAFVAASATAYTACVDVGPGHEGDSCDSQHCARDLLCIGLWGQKQCRKLCHTDADAGDCSSSQTCMGGLPLFPNPAIGLCEQTVGPDL